jgi:hypothetical protein
MDDEGKTRRAGGPRAIATQLPRIAAAALKKGGLGQAQLLMNWREIMGPDLAETTRPERLSFPPGERRDGTLRLRVAPGAGLELQHRAPQILERINGFFGYRAVERLALVQGVLPPRPSRPPAPRPLRPEESANLTRRVGLVPEGELRDALARLGEAVARSRKA